MVVCSGRESGSVAVAAHMLRLEGGELCACIGIEGHAEVGTEAPELGWIERHTDGCSIVSADLLFPLFGALQPMGVKPRQKVGVVHHGFDLGVLLGRVPKLGA